MGLFDGTPLERPVTCARCGKPCRESHRDPSSNEDCCTCPRGTGGALLLPNDQHPRVRRERRRGKWCTIVAHLEDPTAHTNDGAKPDGRRAVLKALRTSLGTGGGLATTKDNDSDAIILQGDHRDAVVRQLCELGYNAKAAGG